MRFVIQRVTESSVKVDGEVIGLDHFGASAPAGTLFKEFGFTVENVVETALKVVGK